MHDSSHFRVLRGSMDWLARDLARILSGNTDRIQRGRVSITRTKSTIRIIINLKEVKAHGKAGQIPARRVL